MIKEWKEYILFIIALITLVTLAFNFLVLKSDHIRVIGGLQCEVVENKLELNRLDLHKYEEAYGKGAQDGDSIARGEYDKKVADRKALQHRGKNCNDK